MRQAGNVCHYLPEGKIKSLENGIIECLVCVTPQKMENSFTICIHGKKYDARTTICVAFTCKNRQIKIPHQKTTQIHHKIHFHENICVVLAPGGTKLS